MSAFIAAILIFALFIIGGVVLFQMKKTQKDRWTEEEKPDAEYVCTRCDDLDCDCNKREFES